jgi:nucleoside-triphosphatase
VAAALVFVRHPAGPPAAAVAAVVAAGLLDPAALRLALRLGLVLALVFAAAVSGAMVALAAGAERGLQIGSAMLLRLVVLVVVATLMARAVDAEVILRWTRRLRLERVGLTLGLAVNVLPHLAVAVRDVWAAHRVRQRRPGRRLARIAALPRLAEVLLAHTARIAEDAAGAAALRGHAMRARAARPLSAALRIVVVTGSPGSGKTEAMTALVAELRRRSEPVGGFVQPGLWRHGRKVGFDVQDVATGERELLAERAARDRGQHGTGFEFHRRGFDLARRALGRAAERQVVVIDELGPLELRGRGHMEAVRAALDGPQQRAAVIVVRRHLVPSLLAALDARDAVVVDVERDEDAVAAVLEALDQPANGPV